MVRGPFGDEFGEKDAEARAACAPTKTPRTYECDASGGRGKSRIRGAELAPQRDPPRFWLTEQSDGRGSSCKRPGFSRARRSRRGSRTKRSSAFVAAESSDLADRGYIQDA